MSEKHFVVQGAVCKCKFSEDPSKTDKIKVKSHKKHFGNDKEGSEKLLATTKEIGQTLEKNTFGKCKKQPAGNSFLPCQAQITKWSGFYEKVTLSNQGKILLENSKATCPMGAPDCIEITDHGQTAEPGEQNFKNAEPMVHNLVNPMVDVRDMYAKEAKHEGIEQNDSEAKGNSYYSISGDYIGTDGIKEDKKFIAINNKGDKALTKNMKSGIISIDIETDNPGIFPVLSQAEIDAMDSLYTKTETDLIEVGMVGGTNSKKERVFAIDLTGSKNAAFDGIAKLAKELKTKDIQTKLEYDVHTHPPIFYFNGTDSNNDDSFNFGINSASPADLHGTLADYKIGVILGWDTDRDTGKIDPITMQKAKNSPKTYFKYPSIMIRDKQISFYNNKKTMTKMDFLNFKKTQQKALSHKI